jgi:hypothetical protein
MIEERSTTSTFNTSVTMPVIIADDVLIKSASFLDASGGPATVDGIIIPMFFDRAEIVSAPGVAIATAVDLGVYKNTHRYDVTFASAVPYQKKEIISVGDHAANTRIGQFRIEAVNPLTSVYTIGYMETSLMSIPIAGSTVNSAAIAAATLVGNLAYTLQRYAASADLGFISLALGTNDTGVQAKIRVALIYTSNPDTAATFATRLAAEEVLWSRFYPFNSQTQISIPGITIVQQGIVPSISPYAPAVSATGNAEKRLMLCFYGETNSALILGTWTLDAEITYKKSTVTDRNTNA